MDREWTIYDKTGQTAKAVVARLEYNGTYKGDRYLSVTVNSPYPIEFEIGDILTYRGDQFSITIIPAAKRLAASGATGTAIVYEGIRFKSTIAELQFTQFTDLVSSDNHIHYTALGTFSFYASDIEDFGSRVKACLDEAYGEDVWTVLYGTLTEFDAFEFSVASGTSIWDALAQWSNETEVNFIVRGRVITLGWQQTVLGHPFVYGRGNGLKGLTQVINADQKIVTRLKSYGSERNIPYRYYNLLHERCYATVQAIQSDLYIITNTLWSDNLPTGEAQSGHQGQYSATIQYGGTTYSTFIRRHNYNDVDYVAIGKPSGMATPDTGAKIYLTAGVNKSAWTPREGDGTSLDSMYISRLMLPGFPDESLQSWCARVSLQDTETGRRVKAYLDAGFLFSTDVYAPFILSPNYDVYGQRDGEVIFDGSDEDWDEIYPSMDGMTVADLSTVTGYTGSITYQNNGKLYQVLTGSNVQDNGVSADGKYEDGSKDTEGREIKTTFTLRIPNIGFDLWQYLSDGETPTLAMKSGMCQSDHGEFEILSCRSLDENGNDTTGSTISEDGKKLPIGCKQYELTLERVYDSNINMYYPNSTYQVSAGDEFVLLGIDMPGIYINAAAVRLLLQSCEWLQEEDHEKPTYQPEIDNIFMALNPEISDGITEGMKFLFSDTELGIAETAVTISQLVIKEGEGGENAVSIPQYEITLNDDVEATLMQQVDTKIHAANSDFSKSFSTLQQTKLSRVSPDTAQGRITFADGWTANGAALLNSIMKSGNFVSGLQGWQMDALGNGEVESMRVRSVLEVTELLINRLQAQEGDTLFTDNDQIEDVEEVEAGSETLYILTLKEKWEGYFTAQQYGNVIKGIINTLAAKEAGISDYQSTSVETDGANKFYTSWMRVEADRDTDQSLGDNQIMVSLYGDSDTPVGKNFPPCKLMTIARWGCHDYSDPTSADYADVLASIKRRQQLFYLSAKDGRIVKLVGVDQPKLRNDNIGTSLGTLPDFVLDYANVRDRVNAGRDYLYAQGIVVSDFVKIDAAGDYVCIDVDKGEWQDNTDYLAGGYNAVTRQYERHFVTHRGCRWMCKYNQPRNGVYVEPAWNSSSWQLSEGNQNLSMEIVSTNGDKFRRDIVNTVLTPHLFYGNMDITADISAASWAWTRESDSGKTAADTAWDASHRGSVTRVKTLTLTNSDMPEGWSSANRAIFTCTVSVNDGESTVIVQNQATV